MASVNRYGIILPHFGEHASGEMILKAARQAEECGFDSVWLRDHLVYPPHGMESQNRTFYEPLAVMSAVSAVTKRVLVGTAALIPHRHPIYLAQQMATLSQMLGPGRLVLGFGIGNFPHEFEVVGLGNVPRPEMQREQVDAMRLIWSGDVVDYHGEYYDFTSVDVHPTPAGEIPVWYCGNSPAAARRAAEYCEGWIAGRLTLRTVAKRVARMRRLTAENGRPMPTASVVSITSPARTREAALAKANVPGLLHECNVSKNEVRPESGSFETADDLKGLLLAGPPERIVQDVRAMQADGVEHLAFDLRQRFGEWDEAFGMLATEILPELRRGDN